MICRDCPGWRWCLRVGPLHIGMRPVRDPQERWDRMWAPTRAGSDELPLGGTIRGGMCGCAPRGHQCQVPESRLESRRTAGVRITGPLFPRPTGKARGAQRAGTPGYPMMDLWPLRSRPP